MSPSPQRLPLRLRLRERTRTREREDRAGGARRDLDHAEAHHDRDRAPPVDHPRRRQDCGGRQGQRSPCMNAAERTTISIIKANVTRCEGQVQSDRARFDRNASLVTHLVTSIWVSNALLA